MSETSSPMNITVSLSRPIPYGDGALSEISLRRPKAGDLRGVKLIDLHNSDVSALLRLIPRVATPHVVEAQLYELDPSDLLALGTELVTFFSRGAASE